MPIITISRGSFSGGKAVAEQLAARLSCPCFSREDLLGQAAREYGVSEQELASSLNETPPFWQQMLGKRMAYVKCVAAVLVDHARSGNLVYHGHVGHLLLGGINHVLRVRVIADTEQRIRSAMQHAGMGRDEAMAHIHRVDKDRARWARLLYGVEWDDPTQYDLLLNLEDITAAGACETLLRVCELPEFKPTPESQQRLEDLSLASRVWAAMARHAETRSAAIHVTANRGEVVITGSAGSGLALETIPRLAREVEGVKSLRCEVGNGSNWYW